MPYTFQQQQLYNHGKSSLPRFLFQKSTAPEDWIGAFVKIFDQEQTQIKSYVDLTYILKAVGIWLDQHARDRGTRRQGNESDDALRIRIRTVEDAVTRAALIQAATQALEADGVLIPAGYPALIETRKDGAFMGTYTTPAPVDSPNSDGRKMAYMSRGYRMRGPRGSIIVILPYGTSEATRLSVFEACRKKKAAGFGLVVERRLNP